MTHTEFIRVKQGNGSLVLQVYEVEWLDSHTPTGRWLTINTLDGNIAPNKLNDEVNKLLSNREYVGICCVCNNHYPNSMMLLDNNTSDNCCHGCAEKYLGVTF